MASSSNVNPSQGQGMFATGQSEDFNNEERQRAAQPNSNTNPGEGIPSTFEEFQVAGSLRLAWMEDPSVPCPITLSNLTSQDLVNQGWRFQYRQPPLGLELDDIQGLDLPCDPSDPTGVIFLLDVERTPDSNAPPISDLTKFVYEQTFNIDGLKYVFVQNTINKQTQAFIYNILYTNERLGYTWGDHPGDQRIWERNSPVYQALLGTRIGKIVSYLLLASYPRGTRRIARVVTYHIDDLMSIHMRFDIEKIKDTQSESEVGSDGTVRRSSRRRRCARCLRDIREVFCGCGVL
ncbi:hypothetical protein PoHVEF18_002913 [Penicillium ochrochloron]